MKKQLLLLSGLIVAMFATAQEQIPNSDFEQWEEVSFDGFPYLDPAPWSSGEFCGSFGGIPACVFFSERTQDANTGNYAIKTVSNGQIMLIDYPFTARPESVEFYAKYELEEGDYIEVAFIFHNNSIFEEESLEIVRFAESELDEDVEGFQKYQIEIVDNLEATSTTYEFVSAFFTINSDKDETTSYVIVDDVVLNYEPLKTNKASDKKDFLLASPNPVQNRLTLNEEVVSYKLISQIGTLITSGNTKSLDMSVLESGIYILQAELKSGDLVTDRIIKQ